MAFHIALRYLISKKGSQAVSFITGLSVVATAVAVAAMFIIISVFSGLEKINRELIANLHADITITSHYGKQIPKMNFVLSTLKKNKNINAFSRVIEEKVYIDYHNNGEIAYLRGVDSLYTDVNPINNTIFYGRYPSFRYVNEAIIENGIDHRLNIPVDTDEDYALLYMPKAGEGIISKESDIFNKKEIYVTGVFLGNSEHLSNHIFAPIELSEELLDLPKGSAYELVLKLKPGTEALAVKAELEKILGNDYKLKTKEEQNAAFWKMINTEKLMIYIIFVLVIFITSFNLAGAIIILQLDKKDQARTLVALGVSLQELRRIYLYTGYLIVFSGILGGLFLGTIVCYIQQYTGFIKAGMGMPFPVEILLKNYLIVLALSSFFGVVISYVFSKINKNYISRIEN
ncbi:lipoprotein-releasing system permease protein [Riemerella columbipharyngis]|uniref:Lipoprotein-releasing system permease protein n=2 Tax=Riemerella columbipharyngis TaxID=1071918 RepID=A0A1G7AY25_9FLAO|nr:lipoprotein-releasing system permease protein [Riemerella columbipharyngis]